MRSKLSNLTKPVQVVVVGLLLISVASIAGSIEIHPAAADSSATGTAIVNAAASQAGVAYCDGGGGIHGPSQPTDGEPTCPKPGFDCMSLAQYAVYQGTGQGQLVPANGEQLPGGTEWNGEGTALGKNQSALEPGDVVFFGGSDLYHYAHSGIYAGNSQVWDALQTGTPVGEHSMADLTSIYTNYQGGVRYSGSVTPPPLSITTTSLPAATIGTRYPGAQLNASGGTSPYKWKVKGLPKGLKVKAKSGLISGLVKSSKHGPAPGSYSVKITVTDKSKPKETATTTLTLTLKAS